MKIARIELGKDYAGSLFCPVCGSMVYDSGAKSECGPTVAPCNHTLFIAHDAGFEHTSAEMIPHLDKAKFNNYAPGEYPEGIDALTDSIEAGGAMKFAMYDGAPSFFGFYVGFSPSEDD